MLQEIEFKKKAQQEILQCRAGDWMHALRVVDLVKKLGKGRKDLPVIVAAAYIHDIGWKGIVPDKKLTFDELLDFEEKANGNSEPFAQSFLKRNRCTEKEILTILRLIHAADAHQSSQDDEMIIVDADNLSKLCLEHLKEKYEKSEWLKMYSLWKEDFPERIKTELGKNLFHSLIEKLRKDLLT